MVNRVRAQQLRAAVRRALAVGLLMRHEACEADGDTDHAAVDRVSVDRREHEPKEGESQQRSEHAHRRHRPTRTTDVCSWH
eukprot:CAMPEP_0115833770 /NCGR_PEP_ID=MMETSP0287-20121206/3342_1 /TAXON_ID=412157 /ORGANISM="Chrysochromulina rotalis, Strain UIO044" /LENGTH=80 /DNA_ID=CAMNT_0003287191 /DNA_START=1079 /DNA_END=1321 /DNA_ORIENTATION=+